MQTIEELDKLSSCEEKIMSVIWDCKDIPSFSNIKENANLRYSEKWKTQTVSTFLNRLCKKGYLRQIKDGRSTYYVTSYSGMDYYKMKMVEILELFYRDDTYSFFADLEKVKNESFAPHDLPSLTAAEEKIFSIILAGNGSLKFSDILCSYTKDSSSNSRSTVCTLIRRIKDKGYVNCSKVGAVYTYASTMPRSSYTEKRLYEVYHTFFPALPRPHTTIECCG